MKENIESTDNFYKYFKTRNKKKINNLTRNKEFEKLDMIIKKEKKRKKRNILYKKISINKRHLNFK